MDNTTLFSQIIRLLPKEKFRSLVDQLSTDKHCKGLDSWTHLVSMIFCQFGAKDSLRTICQGLLSATGNLVHLGIARAPSKSALAHIQSGWLYPPQSVCENKPAQMAQ